MKKKIMHTQQSTTTKIPFRVEQFIFAVLLLYSHVYDLYCRCVCFHHYVHMQRRYGDYNMFMLFISHKNGSYCPVLWNGTFSHLVVGKCRWRFAIRFFAAAWNVWSSCELVDAIAARWAWSYSMMGRSVDVVACWATIMRQFITQQQQQ